MWPAKSSPPWSEKKIIDPDPYSPNIPVDKHESVRGSQYASNDYRKILRDCKMQSSMSRKGDCWDNAVTETLFGSLKVERLHGMRFDTRRLAKDEVIDWITFYNHRRLHSTLGYASPMAFEQKWLASQISLAA